MMGHVVTFKECHVYTTYRSDDMAQQRIDEIDRRMGIVEAKKKNTTNEQLLLLLAQERLESTKERRALTTQGIVDVV